VRLLVAALLITGCATVAPVIQTTMAEPPPPPTPDCPKALGKVVDEGAVFGVVVEKVCLVGASENLGLRLRETVAPREGEALTVEAVRADIEALFATDLLRDVTVTAEVLPSKKLMLSYFVVETDIITRVDFKGVTAVKAGDLEQLSRSGIRATPYALKAVARQIQALYAGLGYARAEVETTVTPLGDGTASLLVTVTEGPRITVSAVSFEGVKKVPQAELAKALKSSVGAPYLEDLATADVLAVTTTYFDRGFINVQVVHEHQAAAPDKVKLVFKVTEGEQFKLGKLSVTGFSIGDEKKVLEVLESKPKTVFSRAALQRDMDRLRERARQRGNTIEVTPNTSVDAEKKTVDITFELVRVNDGHISF
jgi:outer membrane protein insertion porin family